MTVLYDAFSPGFVKLVYLAIFVGIPLLIVGIVTVIVFAVRAAGRRKNAVPPPPPAEQNIPPQSMKHE